jgi:hypothetical protein
MLTAFDRVSNCTMAKDKNETTKLRRDFLEIDLLTFKYAIKVLRQMFGRTFSK